MDHFQVQINVSSDTYLRDPSISDLGKQIISASIDMINELGFESFTFKKLSTKIGSPESSIYRYFKNKQMLLIYLTSWYWNWLEYKLVFATTNIDSSKQQLTNAIRVLTEPVQVDHSIKHINEVLLYQIVMTEGVKTYHTKKIDSINEKGYFEVYKRIVQRVSDIVLEINKSFEFPHLLISSIIEGARQQRYFSEHLPSLTDTGSDKNYITKFYIELTFKTIA